VAALDRLEPELEPLTDPREAGRGRILFAGLDSGWTTRLESALPVRPRVVLDEDPFIHPLLELLDSGSPAGVVLFSAEQARLLEWRVGRLHPLGTMTQEHVEAPHER